VLDDVEQRAQLRAGDAHLVTHSVVNPRWGLNVLGRGEHRPGEQHEPVRVLVVVTDGMAISSSGSRLISTILSWSVSTSHPARYGELDVQPHARSSRSNEPSNTRTNGRSPRSVVVWPSVAQRAGALHIAQVYIVAERRADRRAVRADHQHGFRLRVVPSRAGQHAKDLPAAHEDSTGALVRSPGRGRCPLRYCDQRPR